MTDSPKDRAEELLRLASRCEEASGADREIDAQIGRYFAADFLGYVPNEPASGHCPRFTASLDAALSLLSEEQMVTLRFKTQDDGRVYAAFFDRNGLGRAGSGATRALALTAAALRARAGQS